MRTKEQIENLRNVYVIMFGAAALFMTDEDINRWADKLQEDINRIKDTPLLTETYTIRYWTVRTGLVANHNYTKEDMLAIKPEKENIQADRINIVESCKRVMKKHGRIQAMMVTSNDKEAISILITKEDL